MGKTELQWITIDDERCLKFIFNGHLSQEEAEPVITEWLRTFEKEVTPGQRVNIIWDCLNMSGFDPKVKNTWQKTLKEQRDKIEEIWIISKNPVIRVAALTMGAFTNYKIKTAVSEESIRFAKSAKLG